MNKYQIEVSEEMDKLLSENAKNGNTTIEKFIVEILNHFVISPHILDSEEVKNGYEEAGSINLEWANL